MFFFIASIIMVLIVFFSYIADRKYPSKRIYILPGVFVLLSMVVVATSLFQPPNPTVMTKEQRQEIISQQPKFIPWYADYQQDIHSMNQFSNRYQRITENYITQQISAQDAIQQLQDLHEDSEAFTKHLDSLQPPAGLDATNTALVQSIIKKSKVYQYHINESIRQSISILKTGVKEGLTQKVTSNNLVRIRAIENPVILDISSEVASLRKNLTVKNDN